jgi:ring-1,2-phenylacetyl-CoA epoxidase subunit PaaB
MINSLDPRIAREKINEVNTIAPLTEMDNWETYEVFHQKKRGDQHEHAGIVHAPNPEMALLFGKEQYGRRGLSVNIWVVKTSHVFASDYDDADIFETVPDKQYREAGGYRVMDMINKYKKENKGL